DEGVRLAERVLQVDKNDRIARLVLGVRAIKQKQYPVARRELAQSIRGPITDLAATLLSAWTMANPSEANQATGSLDKLAGADWYAIFKELHSALILDLAGQKKEAAKHFERSYKLDPTALRVVQSYGSFLSRQGNNADALKVFAAFEEALPRHPLIVEATNELKAGKKLPLMVDTPQADATDEVFWIWVLLCRGGGVGLPVFFLQLPLFLPPSPPPPFYRKGTTLNSRHPPLPPLVPYKNVFRSLPRHPLMVEATNELKAGKKLPLMVDTPQAGAAEVLYGIGASLGRLGGEDLGLIYLQLSLYLAPSHPLA